MTLEDLKEKKEGSDDEEEEEKEDDDDEEKEEDAVDEPEILAAIDETEIPILRNIAEDRGMKFFGKLKMSMLEIISPICFLHTYKFNTI